MTASGHMETGLVIPVPSLQRFVSTWRPKVDRVAPVGVPAHVTLLYPFVPPSDIASEIPAIVEFLAEQPPFAYSLVDVDWFGDDVVFVRPSPSTPFTSITAAIHEHWGLPPYGGSIRDPQPHVTIGAGGPPTAMRSVAAAAREMLPISERANEVWLMQGRPDPPHWARTHRFSLGG